jgi:hypothetical protein
MMSTVTTKAGPISGVGVSSIGISSFSLTWSGGEGATNYVFSLDVGTTLVTAPYYPNPYINVSSGYAAFSGLPIGNQYNGLIVYAINPGGYMSSLAYGNVTLLPGAANNLTPSLISPSSFRLTWGGVQGATALAYLGVVPTIKNGVIGPALYTDLFPGSYYNPILVPSNSSGAGVAASTLIKTAPGLVTNITQRLGTGVSLNIAWYDAAGAESYGYLVGGTLSGPIYGSTIFSAIIGGLTPNTTYSTAVVAYASVWPSGGLLGSTLSNYVNFTTGSAAASNLVISNPGAEFFSIGWSGTEGASSLTFHYNNSTITVAAPAANPYLISGLAINTSYVVYIDSANAYGITSSMSIIQITGLGPPVVSTTLITANNFTVTWSGVDTASSITFFYNGISATVSQSSGPTYVVSGLMPNTYYPIYAIARNPYSSSISQTYVQLTAPTLPTNVAVSGITGNQMVISWSDGITSSLTIRYGASRITISGSVASPYTITNLLSNTAYAIYLEVTNPVANLSTVAFTRTTGPSAPVNLVISNVTATQFDVAWSGAVAANALTFYYNSATVTLNTPVASPRTFTGLSVNTPYTVYMVASNANGATSSLSVSQTTGPGAPTNLVASGTGESFFSVGWSGAEGASSLTFTYGGNSITVNANGVQNPYQITSGITVATTYIVYIVAQNSICATSSASISVVTVYPAPNTPTNLSQDVGQTTQNSTRISWSQSGQYSYFNYYFDNGGPSGTINNSPLNVSGLQTDTLYNFTIYATNGSGPAATNGGSAGLQVVTAPGPATNLKQVVGNNTTSIYISWDYKYWNTYNCTYNGLSIQNVGPILELPNIPAGSNYTFVLTSLNNNGQKTANNQITIYSAPAPATSLTVSNLTRQGAATVTWSGGAGASYYIILAGNTYSSPIYGTPPLSYNFTGLEQNRHINVSVSSINSFATTNSNASTTITTYPVFITPWAFYGVGFDCYDTFVYVRVANWRNWNQGQGGSNYDLNVGWFYSIDGGTTKVGLNNPNDVSGPYSGFLPDTAYTFVFYASNPAGYTDPSPSQTVRTAKLGAPPIRY